VFVVERFFRRAKRNTPLLGSLRDVASAGIHEKRMKKKKPIVRAVQGGRMKAGSTGFYILSQRNRLLLAPRSYLLTLLQSPLSPPPPSLSWPGVDYLHSARSYLIDHLAGEAFSIHSPSLVSSFVDLPISPCAFLLPNYLIHYIPFRFHLPCSLRFACST